MEYVKLGPSGVKVSRLCIGTWHLPRSKDKDLFGINKVDVEEFKKILKVAVDNGINFIDTANRYHGAMTPVDLNHVGNAEKILGKLLKDYDREMFVVVTKVRGKMAPWPNGEGLSRKHIMWQIKESLKRLDMEYVDVYLTHYPDPDTPKLETLRALNDIVERGWVHYIGSSNEPAEQIVESMEIAKKYNLHTYVTIQDPYSLVNRRIEERKIPVARKYGLLIMAYSPLAKGLLTPKYLSGIPELSRATYSESLKRRLTKENLEIISELNNVAKELDITLPQLAIAWILYKEKEFGVTIVPIIGVSKLQHLEDNLEALNVKLDTDTVRRVEEIASRFKW
ncbi:MAG: aldo/keto reductase [Thermoproteales archaeon]|nr:aldo/keto reductase [Thermoproteales archaeon]